MPMELYSSEALVRDLVNAISNAEGKPLNLGGNHHRDIDRAYAFQLIVEAKRALDGQVGETKPNPAGKKAAARTEKIRTFMAELDAPPKRRRPAAKRSAVGAIKANGKTAATSTRPASR